MDHSLNSLSDKDDNILVLTPISSLKYWDTTSRSLDYTRFWAYTPSAHLLMYYHCISNIAMFTTITTIKIWLDPF